MGPVGPRIPSWDPAEGRSHPSQNLGTRPKAGSHLSQNLGTRPKAGPIQSQNPGTWDRPKAGPRNARNVMKNPRHIMYKPNFLFASGGKSTPLFKLATTVSKEVDDFTAAPAKNKKKETVPGHSLDRLKYW